MKEIYRTFGIYRITNIVNGKSYIGKTRVSFGDRWDSHRSLLNSGRHENPGLQSEWNEFGSDNFEFAVVATVDDDSVLNDLERKNISEYKAKGKSYNIHNGGDGGHNIGEPLSEEAKRKIGKKNRENMIGRKASAATRKKMSESQLARYQNWTDEDRAAWGKMISEKTAGHKWSNESRRKFSKIQHQRPNGAKFTPDDVREIRRKKSIGYKLTDLAREYNTSPTYISNIVHRRRWAEID